jgi:methylated-DNA-[protein]-cysteine S-methyltransferase
MKKFEKTTVACFQKRVYDALRKVPRGRVVTYKELARFVGCGSARAVGQALRKNPYAPRVPCHRVIASDLSPGGFKGSRRPGVLRWKMRMLADEGVLFAKGKLACMDRILSLTRL